MPISEVHVGDKGTLFQITVLDNSTTAVDLSTANTTTARTIYFRKPGGSITSSTMDFGSGSSGTSGVLAFTVPTTTFFDVAGVWSLQAKVVLTSGEWYSDIVKVQVFENLA